ncbi:hypothetical protein [Deinococcus sp. RIT780]|uniref:hypothetical protein n=1 Tax=Deinococcus sp. RIT780 TaxID=2870472 RepID=UPI001C899D95|nr:hypothetical protein [Deinococcus sp. RIT780]MBX8464849.1 hypothetical protein [Deinococcus sp. RIT780]
MTAATQFYTTTYQKRTAPRGLFTPAAAPFTAAQGAEVILPAPAPLPERDWSQLHAPKVRPAGALTLEQIASVAFHTLGLTRYEPTEHYAFHRLAPSPRCRYPTELHYVALRHPHLPAGLYRYHPVRHTLQPAASPAWWASLLATAPVGCADGWLLSSVPGRVRNTYGDFSTRLMFLEAGHVTEQLRLALDTFGLEGADSPLTADLQWEVPDTEVPVSAVWHAPSPHAGPVADLPVPLGRSLLQRHSGHGFNGMFPRPARLLASEVERMARYALSRTGDQGSLHALIRHVDGLPASAYAFDASGRPTLLRRLGDPGESDRAAFIAPGFDVRPCPLVWFVAVQTSDLYASDRWEPYQQAHGLAGGLAQRLGVAAAAYGLFARPAVSHDEQYFDWLFGFTRTGQTTLYEVLVGRDRDQGFPQRLGRPVTTPA